MIPMCIVVFGATLYDHLRHLLFMVPPCMLAGFGLYLCVYATTSKTIASKALSVLGPGLLLMTPNALIWYPYQYAYLSELARTFPQFAFDDEPLGLSINEAVLRMRSLGIPSFRAGPAPVFTAYDEQKWGIAVDYVSSEYAPHREPVKGGGAYYLHWRPSWNAAGLPDFCKALFTIERQGVILGVGGKC